MQTNRNLLFNFCSEANLPKKKNNNGNETRIKQENNQDKSERKMAMLLWGNNLLLFCFALFFFKQFPVCALGGGASVCNAHTLLTSSARSLQEIACETEYLSR